MPQTVPQEQHDIPYANTTGHKIDNQQGPHFVGKCDSDGNRKSVIFPFNLFSLNHIYIAKYLFSLRDE